MFTAKSSSGNWTQNFILSLLSISHLPKPKMIISHCWSYPSPHPIYLHNTYCTWQLLSMKMPKNSFSQSFFFVITMAKRLLTVFLELSYYSRNFNTRDVYLSVRCLYIYYPYTKIGRFVPQELIFASWRQYHLFEQACLILHHFLCACHAGHTHLLDFIDDWNSLGHRLTRL